MWGGRGGGLRGARGRSGPRLAAGAEGAGKDLEVNCQPCAALGLKWVGGYEGGCRRAREGLHAGKRRRVGG